MMVTIKRLACACLALAFTALCFTALAEGEASVVRAYCFENTLYAWVDMASVSQPITGADLKVGGQSFPATGALGTARQASLPAEFMLLLDISTSMPDFQADISGFGDALAQFGGEATDYTLATFGDVFEVAAHKADADAVRQGLATVQYTAQSTKLYSGLEGALDHYEQPERKGEQLYSIIVMTDGIEYNKDGGITYEALLDRLGGTQVMVHTLGFGQDAEALESLEALSRATGGQHWVLDGTNTQAAAQSIADYLGGLLLARFDISGLASTGGMQDIAINFASNAQLVCKVEGQADIPASDGTGSGSAAPSGGGGGGASSTQAVADDVGSPTGGVKTGVLIAAVAIPAVVILLVVLGSVRRRRAQTPAAQPEPGGIYMRLEVLGGDYAGKTTEFSLTDSLTVGRDARCDLVFKDPSVSRQSAKIMRLNGAVYIEDTGSQSGTLVNGIRIEMPNILRSGDQITVGDAVFRLKF